MEPSQLRIWRRGPSAIMPRPAAHDTGAPMEARRTPLQEADERFAETRVQADQGLESFLNNRQVTSPTKRKQARRASMPAAKGNGGVGSAQGAPDTLIDMESPREIPPGEGGLVLGRAESQLAGLRRCC